MQLDLGCLDSVRKFAEAFNRTNTRLDLLACNAGIMAPLDRHETVDRMEEQFQVGHSLDRQRVEGNPNILTLEGCCRRGGVYAGRVHFNIFNVKVVVMEKDKALLYPHIVFGELLTWNTSENELVQ